jgi:hypothetical protein
MFRACAVATIITAGLAVAACGTDHAPTAPETGSAPSFRTEHSPPGPGAQVSRGEGGFFSTFTAPAAPAGQLGSRQVVFPGVLVTQSFPLKEQIKNMEDLHAKLPALNLANVASAAWMR